jgi:hypothetical protein
MIGVVGGEALELLADGHGSVRFIVARAGDGLLEVLGVVGDGGGILRSREESVAQVVPGFAEVGRESFGGVDWIGGWFPCTQSRVTSCQKAMCQTSS